MIRQRRRVSTITRIEGKVEIDFKDFKNDVIEGDQKRINFVGNVKSK